MPESGPSREPFDFAEPLGEIEEKSFIKGVKSNPHKLVRTEDEWIEGDSDKTVATYKKIKEMFEEIRDKYGVNVTDIDVVLGETGAGGPENKRAYVVVDKIMGQDLEECTELSADVIDKFEKFFTGILQAMFDRYKEGKMYFHDIKSSNFMYGHKSKDEGAENDFFIADVGWYYGVENEEDAGDSYDNSFFNTLIKAQRDLEGYRAKFGSEDVKLDAIEAKLTEMFDYCNENKKNKLQEFFKLFPDKVDYQKHFFKR